MRQTKQTTNGLIALAPMRGETFVLLGNTKSPTPDAAGTQTR